MAGSESREIAPRRARLGALRGDGDHPEGFGEDAGLPLEVGVRELPADLLGGVHEQAVEVQQELGPRKAPLQAREKELDLIHRGYPSTVNRGLGRPARRLRPQPRTGAAGAGTPGRTRSAR